jgi:hypothetical protein
MLFHCNPLFSLSKLFATASYWIWLDGIVINTKNGGGGGNRLLYVRTQFPRIHEASWRRTNLMTSWMILRNVIEYVHMCYCQFLGHCESWEFVVQNQYFLRPANDPVAGKFNQFPDVPSVALHCQQSYFWSKLFVTDFQVLRSFTMNIGSVSWDYCTVYQWTLLPKFRRNLLPPSSLSAWLEREIIKFM